MKLSFYNYRELNFVELNITGTEQVYKKCDSESKYIDTVVFNLFTLKESQISWIDLMLR